MSTRKDTPAAPPPPRRDSPGGNRGRAAPRWTGLMVMLALAVAFFVMPMLFSPGGGARRIPYSTFVAELDSGRIAHVDITDTEIRGALHSSTPPADTLFVTTRVPHPGLVDELRQHNVAFAGVAKSGLMGILLAWVLPTLLFFAFWSMLTRRAAGSQTGLLNVRRSGAQVYVEKDTKVTFADVAGVDEAKAELQEIVAFLRDQKSFGRLGARMPRGVLLVGPPGTGKTLLARAVAGEAGVPFFTINGSEFVEMFVGVGAARVRDLFESARSQAPCIIFIDELDALGRTRGMAVVTGANDEKEQTLNQLLAELDGFGAESGVVFLAATNRPEILDPALLRAGRFDRQVVVDRPDKVGRAQILAVHSRTIRLAPELDLGQVAGLTPGFTGADLANLVNEAALTATRRGANEVSLDDFTAAIERLVAGLARRSRVLSAHERQITAYHEMGHALVALSTPGADPVHKVSIIPRGVGALGYTLQRPTDDRYIATRAELNGKMTVLLGGRAAELVVFKELSTGAADDLVHATELAREMVMHQGMDPTVGNVVYGERPGTFLGGPMLAPESRLYSEQTAREIETAVRALVQAALDRAITLLTLNRAALDQGAKLLVERESLSRDELPAVAPPKPEATEPPRRDIAAD